MGQNGRLTCNTLPRVKQMASGNPQCSTGRQLCDDPEGRDMVGGGPEGRGYMYNFTDSLCCTTDSNTTL